jgi:hypothetical protein
MEAALVRLREALPPPEGSSGDNVNWAEVESELGLTLPTSFKEYIALYGGSNWFDLYGVLYPDPREPKGRYVEYVRGLLRDVSDAGIVDDGCTLYPEPGGLFPFATSSDGDYYFWRTEGPDPDRWPIMVWQMPGLFPRQSRTIAELLLNTLERFREFQPHRVWVRARTRE